VLKRASRLLTPGVLITLSGLTIGVLAALQVRWGNPPNMGICVTCFLRDTSGALGRHGAEAVQYIRPEIIGFVLGGFAAAYIFGEFRARGGSAPLVRFLLGMRPSLSVIANDDQKEGKTSDNRLPANVGRFRNRPGAP